MHANGAAQYGAWEGLPTANEQISLLAKGIDDRGVLSKCNAVLSGYLGSEEQGGHVIDVVKRVKAANPAALYVCDPVMGHPAKGCVVPQGVQDHHAVSSVGAADVVCPNILELGVLTGLPCNTPKEVLAAARAVLRKGPRLCLVKHLDYAGLDPESSFEMLLVADGAAWHIKCPLLPFDRPPVGTGDLTTGLFVASLLLGSSPRHALEATMSAYFEVMQATHDEKEYELQLVKAQDGMVRPRRWFDARQLDLEE